METIMITVTNSKALQLLKDLEELNLIKVVSRTESQTESQPADIKQLRLSQKLYGSISEDQLKRMHEESNEMRNEWDRGI